MRALTPTMRVLSECGILWFRCELVRGTSSRHARVKLTREAPFGHRVNLSISLSADVLRTPALQAGGQRERQSSPRHEANQRKGWIRSWTVNIQLKGRKRAAMKHHVNRTAWVLFSVSQMVSATSLETGERQIAMRSAQLSRIATGLKRTLTTEWRLGPSSYLM